MGGSADRAADFWNACIRGTVDQATKSRRQAELADSAASKADAAVRALTEEIRDRRVSTAAELKAHIEALGARGSAAVESVGDLRRAISAAQVLEPRFAAELGASVDAVQAKLGTCCAPCLAALKEIAREWQRFSSAASSVTNGKVATVQQQIAQLEARKSGVVGIANSNGERLIRECEDEHRQAIAAIDAAEVPTLASRPLQYWLLLIATAGGGALAAALVGAAVLGSVSTALLVGGGVWTVLWWIDRSIERADPARRASLKSKEESTRNERIRRISQEQEVLVRDELERITIDARRLQGELDKALGELSAGSNRSEQAARDMVAQQRQKLGQSWKPLEAIATEVIQLFRSRHARAIDSSNQALREQLLGSLRKCQASIDEEADRERRTSPLKLLVGALGLEAPRALYPYLGNDQKLNVPLVADLMESCYVKHDSSVVSLDTARRLASWHAMEIRQRLGSARVTIFDPAGLGAGYGELLSIASAGQDVGLLAAPRELSEHLVELTRIAATRNRALAASLDPDWIALQGRAGSSPEPAEVFVLEIPRAGLGTEQGAQVETLLGVGSRAGVVLIVLLARDVPQARAPAAGAARQIECAGSIVKEREFSLANPSRDELAWTAKVIVDKAATAKSRAETSERPDGTPLTSFVEFMDAIVPAASRWQSTLANTSEEIEIPVGVADTGEVVNLLFDDGAPHALLIGGTGSGKTNFLHTLIQAGCLKFSPDELRLLLADLKSGVSFEPYARVDGLGSHFGAVACTSSVVFGAVLVDTARQEMLRRYDLFKLLQRQSGRTIKGFAHYRELAQSSDERLPRLLMIIDEFQVLFDDPTRRRQTLESLVTLLKQGRQVGVHVMLATQSLRGRAGDLEAALSQIHTRMMLKAAMSDANSIFRSLPLAERAVAYCSKPGKCFMARDLGEQGGVNFTNPELKGDNDFFFSSLVSLARVAPPAEHLVPIVWNDEVGSLRNNFQFRRMRGDIPAWYLGVPYSAKHALAVPLKRGPTVATMAVEEREHARALLGSLLISLRRDGEDVDILWIEQKKGNGPLSKRDLDLTVLGIGLAEARTMDSLAAAATALAMDGCKGPNRPQVVIVPDLAALSGKGGGGGSGGSNAAILTGGGTPTSSSDVDNLRLITSMATDSTRIVLLLAKSIHELEDCSAREVAQLASVRIASGRLRSSRMREYMKSSELPEMADDDLVAVTDEMRKPIPFRPFAEEWNLEANSRC